MKGIFGFILVLAMMLAMALPVMAQGVTPDTVADDLEPGESMTVSKTVQTPEIPPRPDIYFLADTTGSMGPAIANVQANADTIIATVLAAQSDAQFGVGAYQDFPITESTPFSYQNRQSITNDTALVTGAIGSWTPVCFGGDGPEGWFYALDQIANNPAHIGWRDGSTRILVIFGDAPAHDPVPMAATGLSYDITQATVTAALQAANIRVIAVNLLSGDYPAAGMDDDPNLLGGDYASAYGIVEDGAPFQAAHIAAATGGIDLLTPTPDQVSAQILAGLQNLPITVSWTVSSDPGLVVTLDPTSVTVTSGEEATFSEVIAATEDAPQCQHQYATVTFIDENGNVIGTESIDIHILDITPPEVWSIETANPAGKKIPPAGSTTLPGPKGGMNEDGFYQLLASDNCDPNPMIFVTDFGESGVFGPFPSGIVVKFTEDPTMPATIKKMGSIMGKAGYVSYHIILPTDAVVVAVDHSGNVSWEIQYVPPPPK